MARGGKRIENSAAILATDVIGGDCALPWGKCESMSNPFVAAQSRTRGTEDQFSRDEVALANRNSGLLLETLVSDITPIGAHYLLSHFDVPLIDPDSHILTVAGAFEQPMRLGIDEIRSRPSKTVAVTMECAGNGRSGHASRSQSMPWMHEAVGTSEWTGTPLARLLAEAKPARDVVEFSFTGADRGFDKTVEHNFARSLTVAQATELDVLLVYAMNGQPLLPQHGAPLRIVVPGWYGMASVKWLTGIAALTAPFDGFQQVETYRYRVDDADLGQPVTEIRVRSLMVPPGLPDWSSRRRFLRSGPVEVKGRAWSGGGRTIARVEFGFDGAWCEAALSPPNGRYAWSSWRVAWDAGPGDHILQCRATDNEGNVQPLEPPWDVAGFGNNAVQSVNVYVSDDVGGS